MQILLEHCKWFFDGKGLIANAGKCASLRVVPVAKKQSMKVITKHHWQWSDVKIPPITFENLARYLGVDIQPDGNVRLPIALWESYLDNLSRAHLNPIQKFEAIRQILVAKIQYQLRFSDHGLEEVRKINRLIRKHVKQILHLPTWTSTAWIHHRNSYNILDLVTTTMISRTKSPTKMKTSEDVIAQYTGDIITPLKEGRLRRLSLENINNKRKGAIKKLEEQVEHQNNGKTLTTAMQSKDKRSWLWTKQGIKPGEKLRYSQALSGTLPTKVNKTRCINDLNLNKCKRCKSNKVRNDAYIMIACPYNKGLISKRHDYVIKRLAKEVKNNHPTAKTWWERSWRMGTELLRQDITMVKDDEVLIEEVTIPYEKNIEYLQQRQEEKRKKYDKIL